MSRKTAGPSTCRRVVAELIRTPEEVDPNVDQRRGGGGWRGRCRDRCRRVRTVVTTGSVVSGTSVVAVGSNSVLGTVVRGGSVVIVVEAGAVSPWTPNSWPCRHRSRMPTRRQAFRAPGPFAESASHLRSASRPRSRRAHDHARAERQEELMRCETARPRRRDRQVDAGATPAVAGAGASRADAT